VGEGRFLHGCALANSGVPFALSAQRHEEYPVRALEQRFVKFDQAEYCTGMGMLSSSICT
jgi:hypothetical protein